MVASADRKRISVTRAMRELDAGDGRAVDRRLAVAVGASIIIHALAVTSLRTLIPPPTAQDVGAPNNFAVLQAVLAGPRVEVDAEQLTPLEQPAPPALFLPPALLPIETASQRARVALAPPPGPVPQPGTDHPQVIISVKIIDDPSWLGSAYALSLAQRFSQRAQKPPALIGSSALIYPRAALDAGTSGRVAALLTIDPRGHILDTTLIPEDGLFAPAVANALKTAQFTPAEIDGKPVAYWAIVEYYFSIGRPSVGTEARAFGTPPRQPSVGR
jgi:hypothetical protein